MRVLLFDPDSTEQLTELMLKSESLNVYTTDSEDEVIDLAKLYDYDIIVMDLGLFPRLGMIKAIRTKVKTPILVLSGLDEINFKVRAFGLGADDYMVKPFHKDELIARIHAIVRRSKGHAQSIVKVGDLAINLDSNTVEIAGKEIHLTKHEYGILEILALRKGTVVTKDMMMNHLYGVMNDEPSIKVIDVFICKLRAKLEHGGIKRYINTVWGRGYILQESLDVISSDSLSSNSNREIALAHFL
jgi:two-component system, cell cycle response regulator CtrA